MSLANRFIRRAGLIAAAAFFVLGFTIIATESAVAAPPAHAVAKGAMIKLLGCTDSDVDGFAIEGGACGAIDCDDNDDTVNPGADELCGDGIDNDCDSNIDEGFEMLGMSCVFASDPAGCSVGDAGGCCTTGSALVCSGDLLSLECATPAQPVILQAMEGPPGSASCFDFTDNNCDGLTDHQDPVCQTAELCNSFDDDGDGSIDENFNLGAQCTEGVGACARNGSSICSADQMGTTCSATPGSQGVEGLGEGNSCNDGIDNDCDGLTDADEADCLQAELCDGLDNDGDGFVDEDFVNLGDGCSAGQGVCQANGSQVCTANRLGTMCDATPGGASAEGPTGPTCRDGIDNDCDGFADDADPGCESAALSVQCALPYIHGLPGGDCNGKHRIEYTVNGATPDTSVAAELIAYNEEGEVLVTLPVNLGEEAHLKSRSNGLKYRSTRGRHWMTAPNPVLRVVASNGQTSAEAYCSIVPYLDVLQPSGNVVSVSQGDITEVLAALPLSDPDDLLVKVDGVDILAELGLDPSVDFPGGPYGGTVIIDGQNVEVEDLIVDIGAVEKAHTDKDTLLKPRLDGGSGALAEASSNTLTMRLRNLGGGGHIVLVQSAAANGLPGDPVSSKCVIDDIKDAGTVSVFGIDIFTPAEGDVTLAVPTPVAGEVTHGREIAALQINGLPVDVIGQVFSPGDGENSADEYLLAFNVALDQSDLGLDLATGGAPLGTFDAGSNRLVADASDDLGNRAFADRLFAVGSVGNPLSLATIQAMQDQVKTHTEPGVTELMSKAATEIGNSFVVGLEADGLQRLFDEKCLAAGVEFKNAVTAEILAKDLPSKSISGGCSCNPTVYFNIQNVAINENDVSCPITFLNDVMEVSMNLPDVVITTTARGSCRTEDPIFGACIAETVVDITSTTSIVDLSVDFSISEGQFLGAAPGAPSFIAGTSTVNTTGGSDVNCLAAACNWVAEGVVFLLSFGQADFDLSPEIDVTDISDFNEEIGANEPDPIELGEIQIDEQTVDDFGRAMFSGELTDVQITPNGLVAALSGTFDTQSIDPDVEITPGAVLEPAPVPMLPQPAGGDAFIVLADDVYNQLFASLALSGGLETSCEDNGTTIGDLLVGGGTCEDLTGATDDATATVQGICHGIFGDSCEAQSGATDMLTAIEQGACHGASGANCNTIPMVVGSGERIVCNSIPDLNLMASDSTLFCSRQDVPPRLLLVDNAATEPVESALRLNDLSVFMIVDRDSDGLDSDLAATNNCFSADGSGAGDCSLFSVCLDLNMITEMNLVDGALAGCAPGVPGIVTNVNSIQILNRQEGVVCGAGSVTDDGLLVGAGASDNTVDMIRDNAETFTPPLCAEGLDLGGLLQLTNPTLLTIETDGDLEFQEYLGISGDLEP